MWYVIVWLFVGFASAAAMFYRDIRGGHDFMVIDLGSLALYTIIGPVTTVAALVSIISNFMDSERAYKVLIKGRGKENDGES